MPKRTIVIKIAIMHGKEKFAKIKVVVVISLLKQQIYAIFCQDMQVQTD